METFEETSRITNVSATMFPSLPRALGFELTLSNVGYATVNRPDRSGTRTRNNIILMQENEQK